MTVSASTEAIWRMWSDDPEAPSFRWGRVHACVDRACPGARLEGKVVFRRAGFLQIVPIQVDDKNAIIPHLATNLRGDISMPSLQLTFRAGWL